MVRPREISLVLEKVEEGPYWDRLLASKVKQPWLRIDFKNWKDEDDDEEEGQGQDLGRLFYILVLLICSILPTILVFALVTLYAEMQTLISLFLGKGFLSFHSLH